MEGHQDSFRILRLLESSHGDEPRIEVADVGFEAVCRCGNACVEEVQEGMTTGFLEAQKNVVVNGA